MRVDENSQKTLSAVPFLLTTALERGKTDKESDFPSKGRRRRRKVEVRMRRIRFSLTSKRSMI